jgi:hypothetical protein
LRCPGASDDLAAGRLTVLIQVMQGWRIH